MKHESDLCNLKFNFYIEIIFSLNFQIYIFLAEFQLENDISYSLSDLGLRGKGLHIFALQTIRNYMANA